MTPYYEGTSEAEHLIRGTPELVEAWLKKAKQDRSRLTTRLFQRQKKEFLDGFISGLERHLALVASRASLEATSPERVPYAPVTISPASPVLVELVPESDLPRGIAPIVDPDSSPTDNEPVAQPLEANPTIVFDEPVAELECLAQIVEPNPSLLHEEPVAEVETLVGVGEAHFQPVSDEPDSETEMAMGVMKLSGWAGEKEPDSGVLSERADTLSNALDGAFVQTGGPVPSVEWNRVFEQARGVGMVDLSAYDFIDGLGELRELIDRWQNLHQSSSSLENL
ncbi:hypothetical protein [Singulisphaera acidiphila]|uniref:Uncharacterized protein n=1 Tax=Singulisphaera acidiphila (strain ATCC BAA-1392 / DSM 18658 / VKM B-2454 / MOB10) TaxID=886293 RepID=L0DBW9_SINAD|nr:hypothetical protein [Singulisphaera acidiphila]AGA26737.1 hypothetical protein Sinac_2426 [Singulisphaera acidiphila DSM 18658]